MVGFLCSALDVSTGVVFRVTSSRRHFKSEAGSIWRKKMRFVWRQEERSASWEDKYTIRSRKKKNDKELEPVLHPWKQTTSAWRELNSSPRK